MSTLVWIFDSLQLDLTAHLEVAMGYTASCSKSRFWVISSNEIA